MLVEVTLLNCGPTGEFSGKLLLALVELLRCLVLSVGLTAVDNTANNKLVAR